MPNLGEVSCFNICCSFTFIETGFNYFKANNDINATK